LAEDEYVVDTPRVHRFIADVRAAMAASDGPEAAVAALRPVMAELLAEDGWLPDEFEREADPSKGMGGGIGTWLIYRSKEGDLSLFTLVVPGWRSTPVHDHLAWGLIGLYRGEQAETFYQRLDQGEQEGAARLEISERRMLQRGDLYELIPPDGDIHSVITIGEEPSVSLHLLANDVGCIWRHAFDPPTSSVKAFRSGYTNRACPEESES
jgi:predicted metal-dependent enzyme (double-stranded beta helix superfamily)